MNENRVLTIDNLTTTFKSHKQKIQAVRGVSLYVKEGDILAIVGESGSGKSVTMKSVMGLLGENAEIQADHLELLKKDLLSMSEKEKEKMRGIDMAMVFQDPMTALNPLKKIGGHMIEVLCRHQKLSKKEARKVAVDMLAKVGISSPESRMEQYPHEFSGGMRQRVMIAMALCCQPRLLIADEPTTALDVTIQAQILQLLKQLNETEHMNIILITHDLGVVASLAKRIEVMYGGLIMEEKDSHPDVFYRKKNCMSKRRKGRNNYGNKRTISPGSKESVEVLSGKKFFWENDTAGKSSRSCESFDKERGNIWSGGRIRMRKIHIGKNADSYVRTYGWYFKL